MSIYKDIGTGFVVATVLENNNDKAKGLLKLQIEQRGKVKHILENVRVLTPFSGDDYGIYALPDVGEQVVVGFLGDSFDKPFVIGSLSAPKDKSLAEGFHKSNAVKRMKTKGGHLIEISDDKDEGKVSIKTAKGLQVEMGEKNKQIKLVAGDCTLVLDGSSGKISLKAKEIELKADTKASVEGANVEIKGNMTKIN